MDGGAGVNVMLEHTRKALGITTVKPAPFKVRMANQRAIQPQGLVEDKKLRIEGARFTTSFLILDVGTLYSMLLGRPWLKMAKALHTGPQESLQWNTNPDTWKSRLVSRLESARRGP